jgi:hypothetical protein
VVFNATLALSLSEPITYTFAYLYNRIAEGLQSILRSALGSEATVFVDSIT